MENSVEKVGKITKEIFVQAVVFKGFCDTNKSIANELGISESYYYKLLKKYTNDIAAAIQLKKNSIRLKAISVLDYHLDKKDLRTAIEIMKQIGWQDELDESNEVSINAHFKLIADVLRKRDTE